MRFDSENASDKRSRQGTEVNSTSWRCRAKLLPSAILTHFAGDAPALPRELTDRIEQRPGPPRLTLDGLGKADQIARIAGVELDHAARQKALVRTDKAALRCLAIVRMRGKIYAEERTLDRSACGSFQRCGPTAQQHTDDALGDHLDAADHFVDLLPLHAPNDCE